LRFSLIGNPLGNNGEPSAPVNLFCRWFPNLQPHLNIKQLGSDEVRAKVGRLKPDGASGVTGLNLGRFFGLKILWKEEMHILKSNFEYEPSFAFQILDICRQIANPDLH
jgi:hypothetical protein